MRRRLVFPFAVLVLLLGMLPIVASAQGAAEDVIPGQYIVVLKPDVNPGSTARVAARAHGVEVLHVYEHALNGFAIRGTEQAAQALERNPHVQYINPDRVVSLPNPQPAAPPCHVTGTCDGGGSKEILPWGVDRINADANTNEGAEIHVYVLDTGIDSDHPDLQANLGNGYAVETCKGGSCKYAWDDDHGHGTHVAGTIGAIDNDIDVIGVASQVKLHAVKVLSKSGSGSWSGVVAGVDWTASETKKLGKATVANMSLGGSGSKTGTCTDTGFTGTDSLHQAICNAKNAGVVFAVAAGNDGADAAGSAPAAYDDAVITVSATKQGDDWTSWSNWGDDTAAWTANGSAPVAIAAPGDSILSTKVGGGTTTMSGTSMASPHVAGAIALYLKTNTQGANGSAFTNTRAALLSGAEETTTDSTPFKNSSGNPHNEDFLNAGGL